MSKFREGKCTPEEIEMLELWFDLESYRKEWEWESEEQRQEKKKQILESVLEKVKAGQRPGRSVKWGQWWRVAAVIGLAAATGVYYLLRERSVPGPPADFRTAAVEPGSSKAMLTLADGSSILIDEARRGVLTREGSSQVVKTTDGHLEYRNSGQPGGREGRNSLAVPKGGNFQLTLPDGSQVWLNSATRLTYFSGDGDSERMVELSGEAYFEVKKDPDRPFRVRTEHSEVLVTGTHFNISSYPEDETEATTLIEGQVVVARGGHSQTLSPGKQAAGRPGAPLQVREADVQGVLAWKEGYFSFDDQDLASVMRMVARWYDVEVEFRGGMPQEKIGGTYSRSKELSGLLTYLEQLSSFHFKQQGKKIMVERQE